jgi:hypothetical protein
MGAWKLMVVSVSRKSEELQLYSNYQHELNARPGLTAYYSVGIDRFLLKDGVKTFSKSIKNIS